VRDAGTWRWKRPLNIELSTVDLGAASDIERAIAAFSRISDGGLILVVSARGQLHRELIATLAAQHRLPHRLSLSLLRHERRLDLLWA
jgi:hypothetical protein